MPSLKVSCAERGAGGEQGGEGQGAAQAAVGAEDLFVMRCLLVFWAARWNASRKYCEGEQGPQRRRTQCLPAQRRRPPDWPRSRACPRARSPSAHPPAGNRRAGKIDHTRGPRAARAAKRGRGRCFARTGSLTLLAPSRGCSDHPALARTPGGSPHAARTVLITGSRLSRTDTETPAPVQVITQERSHGRRMRSPS